MSGIFSSASCTQAHWKGSSQWGSTASSAAGGRLGLGPKCRVTESQSSTTWHAWIQVQVPGATGRREFCCCVQRWFLSDAPQQVWKLHSKQKEQAEDLLCKLLRAQPLCMGKHKAVSRHILNKHLQFIKRCKQANTISCNLPLTLSLPQWEKLDYVI